jgi:RNA polymerase sigma factor (sigma-70 family)
MTTFRNKKTETVRLGSEELKHLGEKMPDESCSGDEEEEKLQFFHAFMQKLPAADRTLVSLYLEDMESADIAEVTGLSDANVRTRIHRIKKQIKEDWEVRYGTR